MKLNRRFLRINAFVLLLSIVLSIVSGCGCQRNETAAEPTDVTIPQQVKTEYTISLKTEGGKPLAGIGIYVYTDDTMQELENFVKTDDQGIATFSAIAAESYTVVLDNVPEGYDVQETYQLTDTTTEIVLTVAAGEGDLANITYELGDVMLDFTVVDCDGEAHVLSELLQQKKAVVLNFWYVSCNPCRAEFPYMQEAYEKYSDDIEILAMNPVDLAESDISAFRDELNLTMPVAMADTDWGKAMQLKAYPTTVVIDRYGTIAMIHQGSIQETETFERIFAFFTDDDYVQTTVQRVEDLPELEKPGSNIDDPIEIGSVTKLEITVEPGQLIYYHLYRVDNMYLSIRNKDAYVVYNQRTYEASNGSVGLTLSTPDTYTPAKVAFGNAGTEKITYTVNLSPLSGTINNPYTLSLGDFTTTVRAGNDQGVYYTHKATETGLFTIQCLSVTAGVRYDYSLYNLNTYAMRTLREDSIEDGDGNDIVSVYARKGDTIQVIVSTLPDSSNSYPSATFTTRAYFREGGAEDEKKEEEKLIYAVTVTDADRKPISNVILTMDISGKSVSMATDENGVAYTKQVVGTYEVTLRIPEGFTTNNTKFNLTPEAPVISLKLDQLVENILTYTVHVEDEQGNPISGATVMVGSNYGTTDASGNISFTLLEDDYTVMVNVSGVGTKSFRFADGATSLTAVVELGTSDDQTDPTDPTEDSTEVPTGDPTDDPTEAPTEAPTEEPATEPAEPEKLIYSVRVVDYDGNAVSGVLALFGDAMVSTDSNGIATAELEAGTYPVTLAFTGTTRYYEESTAVLTATNTSVTIKVADGIDGEYDELYINGADFKCYYVDVGGTYVTMQSDAVNYFLFAPEDGQEGLYRVSTSDSAAILSYWGGNTFFVQQVTPDNYVNNTFTCNVKNSGPTYIIGITGTSDCILEIIRIGDPVLSEVEQATEVIYEGSSTPTVVYDSAGKVTYKDTYTVSGASGKTMKFVDLTGNATAVYNSSDGLYHLYSADGPVLYLATGYLGKTDTFGATRWKRFCDAFAVTLEDAIIGFYKLYTNDSGTIIKENYYYCMQDYIWCADTKYGVYPVTDDIIYMLQQGGGYMGWYNSESANYIVPEDERGIAYNTDILWMFNCCYFE